MSRPPNRLSRETSPYLLQHQHNPVDWYAWGAEALDRAAGEDKPILLSIGYAACHWCHVMERESFEDEDVAALMNEHFVCIKVDREERPDIDSIYMDAVQAMTGHGGWPMTMFLTPAGVPFFGGTYFPPEDRQGMPSFTKVLQSVAEVWTTRRPDVEAQGRELVSRLQRLTPAASSDPLSSSLLSLAAQRIAAGQDALHGGFGNAPKFPQAPVLEFLLRAAKRGSEVRGPLDLTLGRMALGGIYDQLGGGFHRYAVDREWLVPHFEKMLYDNAQLARVYLHAWQSTRDPLYSRIAVETLDYLLHDMRTTEGGFASSEDADSEGVEGKFYVFAYDEFMSIAPDAADYYGVAPGGNFEGQTILTAAGVEPPPSARAALLDARNRRVRPGKDDKVLASWNGLAIAALAEVGDAFGVPRFIAAAEGAAAFVLDAMRTDVGRLLHSFRAGQAKVTGLLEDYAYLADGLLELWHATFDRRWLDACRSLAESAIELFADADGGGFYVTGSDHETLIVRQKDIAESATPSPGAVLALVLQRLSVLFDEPSLRSPAVNALRVAHLYMERAPQAAPTWLCGLDFYTSTPKEVALVGDLSSDAGRALRSTIAGRFLPNRVVAGAASADDTVALLRDKAPIHDAPTAFVCERYACKAPTGDPVELARQLEA